MIDMMPLNAIIYNIVHCTMRAYVLYCHLNADEGRADIEYLDTSIGLDMKEVALLFPWLFQ